MRKTSIAILLALAVLAAESHAGEVLVVELRGTFDGATVKATRERIEAAWEKAPTHVFFDIALDSALGDAGLTLAEIIEKPPEGVETAALLTGKAPGASLALALACSRVYATRSGVLGPIPAGGAVQQALGWNPRVRRNPNNILRRLIAKDGGTGLTAASAERAGLLDSLVSDREEALADWGHEADPVVGWTAPVAETTAAGAWPRLKGPYKKPYLIPIDIAIDDTLYASAKRRVEQAKAEGADLVIFEVDSPGGYVHSSMDIGDLIFDLKLPTLILILKRAHSGAALISLAGDEIVMGKGGEIGDCQPISIGPSGYAVLGEKIQSPLRAIFRKFASKNGYPQALAESMVTQQMEVLRVDVGGEVRYVAREELEDLQKRYGDLESKVVVKKDQLLTMFSDEAFELGFCGEPLADREAAYRRHGIDGATVTRLEETWAEETSRFLLGIKVLLFLGGITALYMELKAPGFGVPGAISIICFALFFSASAIAGISSGIEVALFILGIGLLALEILVIPGFGIPGFAGFLLILLSLYMGSVRYSFGGTGRPWDSDAFGTWMLEICGAILGSIVVGAVVARYLPKTALGRKIILAPAGPPGSLGLSGSGSVDSERHAGLVGSTGTALSDLRPAGRIEIDGEPYDAVTQGGYIDRGTGVTVLHVKGNRIVVKRA